MKEVGGAVETKVSRSERGEEKNFTLVLAGKKSKATKETTLRCQVARAPSFSNVSFSTSAARFEISASFTLANLSSRERERRQRAGERKRRERETLVLSPMRERQNSCCSSCGAPGGGGASGRPPLLECVECLRTKDVSPINCTACFEAHWVQHRDG